MQAGAAAAGGAAAPAAAVGADGLVAQAAAAAPAIQPEQPDGGDASSTSGSSDGGDEAPAAPLRGPGAQVAGAVAAPPPAAAAQRACADSSCQRTFPTEMAMKNHFNSAHAKTRSVAAALMLTEYGQCGSCRSLYKITGQGVLTRHGTCPGSGSAPAVGHRAPAPPPPQPPAQFAQAAAAAAALGQGGAAPFVGQNVGAPPVLGSEADWKPYAVYLSEQSWLSAWSSMLKEYSEHARSGNTAAAEKVIIKLLLTPLDVPRQHGGVPKRHRGAAAADPDQPDAAPHLPQRRTNAPWRRCCARLTSLVAASIGTR